MGIKQNSDTIISAPVKLTNKHLLDNFDCGINQLNTYLTRFALQNQYANAAITFVVCEKNSVIGYYSLAVGSVEHELASLRIKKGLAHHPIPIMILARLAVDLNYQKKGIGKGLLKDAIFRTLQASQHAGIRAILVHAKNQKARNFYEQFDFEPSPIDPLKLMLLLKDAKKAIST